METERASPRYSDIDLWEPGDILDALVESQMAAVAAVRPALVAIEAAAGAIEARLGQGGRLIYANAHLNYLFRSFPPRDTLIGKTYQELITRFKRTQDDVAKEVGKSRSHIANTIRLLFPLTISDQLYAEALEILSRVVLDATGASQPNEKVA